MSSETSGASPARGLGGLSAKLAALAVLLWRRPRRVLLTVLILESGICLLERTDLWEHVFKGHVDWFMGFYTGEVINADAARPLAFVDIDDQAFAAHSQDHSRTDRSFVVNLIKQVTSQNPIAVIVDLDVSSPADGDDNLRDLVKAYGVEQPPLIFVRPLRRIPTKPAGAPLELVPEPFGNVVANAPIFFAAAGFPMDSDGIVRDWNLIEPVSEDHGVRGLPSLELLVLAIIQSRDKQSCDEGTTPAKCRAIGVSQGVEALKRYADERYLAATDPRRLGIARDLDFSGRGIVKIRSTGTEGRVFYTIRWPIAGSQPMIGSGDRRTVLLRHCLADQLDAQTTRDCGDGSLTGRIVLIGGSNAASRDLYATPIGAMPGALVLLNSINSLLQTGQLHGMSFIKGLLLGFALGIATAAVLQNLRRGLAMLLGFTLPFLLAVLMARSLIGWGIWIDLSAPMMAMAIDISIDVEGILAKIRNDFRRVGWRALLRQEGL